MAHLFEDLLNLLGPDKRSWILIVDADELLNGLDQLRDTFEHTAPDSFARNFAKPALDQIEPGRTGGHDLRDKVLPNRGQRVWREAVGIGKGQIQLCTRHLLACDGSQLLTSPRWWASRA